jgi:hypothetical protein
VLLLLSLQVQASWSWLRKSQGSRATLDLPLGGCVGLDGHVQLTRWQSKWRRC